MDSFNVEILLTAGGVAIVTTLIIRTLIRPALRARFLPEDGAEIPPKVQARYASLVNLSAALVGIVLSLLATLALAEAPDGGAWISAALVGLVGGLSSIGVHEAVDNTRIAFSGGG